MEQAEKPNRPALPLLVLLAFASALGVAVAVALAGIAMLLAAPAYAGEGSLLLERRAGSAWADQVSAESESFADGVTRVIEAYQNPYGEPLVGVYLHRLPPHAVVERLTFTLGDAAPQAALLTRRPGGAIIERVAELGPDETLLVELVYRARVARRVLAARP